jgi:site-specific recombinase XerD
MNKNDIIPLALIDSLKNVNSSRIDFSLLPSFAAHDLHLTMNFLTIYSGNNLTFVSYRRELERLLQWSWLVVEKSILELSREDIEAYIQFCMKPPKEWIGKKRVSRYIDHEGERVPNPVWRPFLVKVSKSKFKQGKKPRITSYQMSQSSIRALFAVLGSFYNHLLLEEKIQRNPIASIRQKSRYLQKQQKQAQIIRLTDEQWQACLNVAKEMAEEKPKIHERTLFIISAMYLMYLRISEFVAVERWMPSMNHFYRDSDQQWWFKVLGKGNKLRAIAVSDDMLAALSHYRENLDMSPLPSPSDHSPLIPKNKGRGPMKSTRQIRRLIQACFDRAILALEAKKLQDEADSLATATVHWLRHTGISDDVNKRGRPIMHVRDDAGHASIVTTGGYSDVERKDRHQSAKRKTVDLKKEKDTEE